MSTHTPPIGAECPDPDCGWITYNPSPRQVVFTHLVEKHGYIDTTAHVLAHEATTPADPNGEDDSGHVCRH